MRAVAAFAACAPLFAACDGAGAAARAEVDFALELGTTQSHEIDLADASSVGFAFDVPASARALRVEVVAQHAECELRLLFADGTFGDEAAVVATELGRGVLRLDRFGPTPLRAGIWQLSVAHAGEGSAREGTRLHAKVPFTVRADVFQDRVDATLEAGRAIVGRVGPSNGGFATFRFDVPAKAVALRLDVLRADGDVDLALRRADAGFAATPAAIAEHGFGRESIVLARADEPKLSSSSWCVDVLDPLFSERDVSFTLLASFDARAPDSARDPLTFARVPVASSPLARAAAAVVEVFTESSAGSAVCIDARGIFLTNAHVVERIGGGASDDVVLAVARTSGEPAVESFRAKVERFDAALDLALLRITSGFAGEPVPDGFAFPSLAWNDDARPASELGATLYLIGFPSTGSQSGRVTQSTTRGIVAGFERSSSGLTIKTDAVIASGSSGGAAIDEKGRLVGIQTALVESGAAQIGYVVAVGALPAEWRALLAR